jgi:Uma2 family endonuclease
MSHDRSNQHDSMDVDDFEELLADMPNDQRWELIGGRVVKMMVGARWQHNVMIQNLAGALRQRFRSQGSDCRTFSETFFMKAPWLKTTTLPDVIVRCGRLAEDATSLDDPKVLIEVVSPGSEGRDWVEKWKAYRQLPSLEHYVLVERDRAVIDVFDRTGDAWAVRRTIEGLASNLTLPAVGVSTPLTEIYEDVLSA